MTKVGLGIYLACALAAVALILGLGGCVCIHPESPARIVTDSNGQVRVISNPDRDRTVCWFEPAGGSATYCHRDPYPVGGIESWTCR